MIYTLKVGDTEREASEWGIDDNSISIRLANLGIDYLTFSTTETFDATPQFANGQTVTLYRREDDADEDDKVQLFTGQVDRIRRLGTDGTEGIAYSVAGPWYWLERTIFVATWKVFVNPLDESEGLQDFENSHVILLLHQNGTKVKTAAQILTLINYVIDAGAPLQYDATGCPDIDMPLDEVRDLSPAECIRRLIKLVPNCASWFDYSTTPPTLYLKQRPDLAERTLTVEDIIEVELDERHDLIAAGVVITYEKIHRLNGIANTVLDRRPYPPGASATVPNTVIASVSLEGATRNEVIAEFTTEPAPTVDGTNESFWTAREATINQPNISGLTLGATTREQVAADYPYVVTGGIVPEWAAQSQEDTFKTSATYNLTAPEDSGTTLDRVKDEPLTQRVTVTNRAGGTYRSTVEEIAEESTPVGLETAIYTAMSQLHYDGRIVVGNSSGEYDPSFTLGQVINISGMRAEWTTMKAQVQSITHDLSSGQTTIQVGPPKHLGVDDIIEILRHTRFRMRWTSAATPTSGRSTSGTRVELNGKTTQDNTQKGRGEIEKMTIGRLINIDVSDVSGKSIQFREVPYCENGVQKKMLVLASEVYV